MELYHLVIFNKNIYNYWIIIGNNKFCISLYRLFLTFFPDRANPGISTLIVAIFFFSGIQLLFLGVVGEYVAAIHRQVRKPKKNVIVKEFINILEKKMDDLENKKCVPCEGGVKSFNIDEIHKYQKKLMVGM